MEKGIDPLAYRFWLLMANYRTKMNFNWDALKGAEMGLKRLQGLYNGLGTHLRHGQINEEYQKKFQEFIEDDLDTPGALTVLWDLIKDENISLTDRKATILDFDKVLGLGFDKIKKIETEEIPEEIKKLAEEREQARQNKDYKKSDELREKINSLGYEIKDSTEGYKINKI